MKTSSFKSYALGLILAAAFAAFLLYGTLSSSNFPRGTFGCPYTAVDSHWTNYAQLHVNLAGNARGAWNPSQGTSVETFFDDLGNHNVGVILHKGYWDPGLQTADSIPYLVDYHAWGQYNELQVEWDSIAAAANLYNLLGDPYYFFRHDSGATLNTQNPGGGESSLRCRKDSCQGTIHPTYSWARYLIAEGIESTTDGSYLWEPSLDFRKKPDNNGMFGYYQNGRILVDRINVAIDNSSSLAPSDTVIKYNMCTACTTMTWDQDSSKWDIATQWTDHNLFLTKSQFDGDLNFKTFSLEATVPKNYTRTSYQVLTWNTCDIYVDKIEYMDKEQGYPLFWNDSLRQITLNSIVQECEDLLDTSALYNDVLAGFYQSNEPFTVSYRAHGVVNDLFRNTPSLAGFWPQTATPVGRFRRPNHFMVQGRPKIYELNQYVFADTNSSFSVVGQQAELDTLVHALEWCYQVCGDSIPLHFTGQVHSHIDATAMFDLRSPVRSEILAEAFLALAHGAKGIAFYRYQSTESGAILDTGLVDQSFHHTAEPYLSKWQAVADVFAQLDSMGGTLLNLTRVGAYCAKDANGNFAPSLSLDSVYFQEESRDSAWIEVGQFQDASDNEYLIIVNRRTDYNRHITVRTKQTGSWALWDLYAQELFISSTGDFRAIPFDSGEGRIFKLQQFSAWIWSGSNIVLADTVEPIGNNGWTTVASGTTVKATAWGFLNFSAYTFLHCNGDENDSIVFTALEEDAPWQGICFSRGGYTDELTYTKIEHVSDTSSALRLRDNSEIYVGHCLISANGATGVDCQSSSYYLERTIIRDNGGSGVSLVNADGKLYACDISHNGYYGIMASSGSVPKIGDCVVDSNNLYGVSCRYEAKPIMLRNATAYPYCGRNKIRANSVGVLAELDGMPHLGFNDHNQGLNSIYDNTYDDAANLDSSDTLFARYNWWGSYPPNASQFYGLVDYSHPLTRPPQEDNFFGGSPFVKDNPGSGVAGGGPGDSVFNEAERLNNVAVELFLDGEYYAAVDTFTLVVNNFPASSSARFALNHIVVCYREAEDYEGAVAYLNDFLLPPTDPTLVPLALYHKVLNLARLQEYPQAVAIAVNAQLSGTWELNLLQPTLIELGMMLKYGMSNVVSGDSVFQQFLLQYPASDLAPIAAMELGQDPGGRGTSGRGVESVVAAAQLPADFRLYQNYPNPFNPTTVLSYQLPAAVA